MMRFFFVSVCTISAQNNDLMFSIQYYISDKEFCLDCTTLCLPFFDTSSCILYVRKNCVKKKDRFRFLLKFKNNDSRTLKFVFRMCFSRRS